MHRHGKTNTGKERYKCPSCGKTSIIHRPDTRDRHIHDHFVSWLTGKKTKTEVAEELGITRQALSLRFHAFFAALPRVPVPSPEYRPRILIVDGTYVNGVKICILISLDEEDHIFWAFVERERYLSWVAFLERFARPDIVVADGQKGLKSAVDALWPGMPFQRCQFHVIKLVHEHITREPKEEAGKKLLALLYELKHTKTKEDATMWRYRYICWEKIYEKLFKEKTDGGSWRQRRLRKARGAMRKALPHLFAFLDHEGCPNTTNDVEGWINGALKEAVREHRGLRVEQQKVLVSILLSHLSRRKKSKENPTRNFP